jgi:hypothetical protein
LVAIGSLIARQVIMAVMRAVVLAVLTAACVSRGEYVCTSDGPCGPDGTCEANGRCSFVDATCPDSMHRFGSYAGSLSGTCVTAELCGQRCASACRAGMCVAGVCQTTVKTGPCDDGIACTVGDMCQNGVCESGGWDSSPTCAAQTVDVYRSVGPNQSLPVATAAGSNGLAVIDGVAYFLDPLPDDVGVGDVLQYDSDGDGTSDAIAFVHQRMDAHRYVVRDAGGASPVSTDQEDHEWAIYRAYTSLANAIAMIPNPSLLASVRAFEACPGDCDLAAKHRSYHLACYAGQDDDRVYIQSWNPDAQDWLTIYTPTSDMEVGASQRHGGKWGDGYRRTQGIDVDVPYVRLDGLSERVAVEDRVYLVSLAAGHPGRVEIDHCYGEMAYTPTWYRVYDFWGSAALTVTVASSIGVTDSTESDSFVFYDNQPDADAYIYDCTAIAAGGAAFRKDYGTVHIAGGIAQVSGNAIGYANFDPVADTIDYSVASDGSLASWAGQGNASSVSVQFVDAAGGDFHLAAGDTAARGKGVDLSTDPNLPVTDDIDGDPRPTSGPDIGADQTK